LESVVVDEQGRSAVRFELQPGGDGHCGEDLEWALRSAGTFIIRTADSRESLISQIA
jgi:hypothetical protein